jgi:hypothetical protein
LKRPKRQWKRAHALGTRSNPHGYISISISHRRWCKLRATREFRILLARMLFDLVRRHGINDENPMEEGLFETYQEFLNQMSDSLEREAPVPVAEIPEVVVEDESIDLARLSFFRALGQECMLAHNTWMRVTPVSQLMGQREDDDEDLYRSLAAAGMHITKYP